VADDPKWDDPVAPDPNAAEKSGPEASDEQHVRVPPTTKYLPPTRRQLRENEARAKAREAAEQGIPPLVNPEPMRPITPHTASAAAAASAHVAAIPATPAPAAAAQPTAAPSAAAAPSTPTPSAAVPSTPATASQPDASEFAEPALPDNSAYTGYPGSPVNTPSEPASDNALSELLSGFDRTPTGPPKSPRSGDSRPPKKRRRFVWLWVLITLLVLGGGAAAAVWVVFEDQVRSVMGWELPNDYEGTGNGEAVTVTIVSGDVGSDIAAKLEESGVTMTAEAFYDVVVAKAEQPVFLPGSYQLQKEMSAESALTALTDPANIVTSRVLITEGSTISQVFQRLSDGTGVPLADYEAAAQDIAAFGVPSTEVSLEGWLFPATYDFEPGVSAQDQIQTLANRMIQALDEAGVPVEDRHRVLTLASIVQKEGGSTEDFYIVSRLFQNRLALAEPMKLQSDATVSYGTGGTSIHTTTEEREDASNPYNTYANPGLPVGPISAPGDDAIDAVMHPAEGDWIYMVLVNGDTGETVFSTNFDDHLVAVDQWLEWYDAHPNWDN